MAEAITQDMLLKMLADVSSMSTGINQIADHFTKLDKGIQEVGKSTGFLNQTLSVFTGTILANIAGGVTKAFGTIKGVIDSAIGPIKEYTMEQARIEVQWRTLSLAAGNAGKSFEEVEGYVKALRAAGIKTSEALESVTQFLAAGLPVEGIKELARRAQDMAVVIGRDSTEAFQRFNWFLQTGNSEWIRTMGITKTATQMIEDYAKAQNKTVKALTDREKKEALVQGLMKATIGYEGAYEEAMKDPYKRWTSLPRLISNATEVIGAVFVPMMGTVVDIISDALERIEGLFRVTKKGAYAMMAEELGKAVEDLTSEDKAAAIDKFFGQWKEGFFKLRAVVSVFADWLKGLWDGLIGDSEDWGESLMDNIVDGIVAGTTALAQALVKVTGFIADFLAPGSAPKMGPLSTIDKWGIELMRTYMQGWTKVDFQTFQEVAGVIESSIQAAFTAAGTAKEQKGALLEQLLGGRQLAAQLVTEGIGAVAGQLSQILGPQIYTDLMKYLDCVKDYQAATEAVAAAREKLARAEAWVKEAADKVAEAEKKVAKTQEWVEEASKKVEEVRRRVAKLEAQWAEIPERFTRGRKRQLQLEIEAAEEEERRRREVLEQQQKQVKAAQEEEESRRAAIEAAQAEVKAAEEYARARQEAVELHKAQLDELQKQMEMEAKLAEERAKAQEDQELDIEQIKNDFDTLDEQMQKYKDEIKERLQPAFDNLALAFSNIKDIGGTLWETLKKLPGLVAELLEKLKGIQDWFDGLPPWVQDILKGAGIAVALNFVTGGAITSILSAIFSAAGLIPGVGWTIAAGMVALTIAIKPFLSPEVREEWKNTWKELTSGGNWFATGAQAAETTIENTPIFGSLLKWVDSLSGKKPEVEKVADETIAQPFIDAAERASGEIVGASILPEMIQSILDWFGRLATDVVGPLDQFSNYGIETMNRLADAWTVKITSLTENLARLTSHFDLLSKAIKGIPPIPSELQLQANGTLKIINVDLRGSTFGGNLTESEIKDWMYDAMAGVAGA